MAVPDEGFKLNLGGHLLEDSGQRDHEGLRRTWARSSCTAPSRATCPSGTTRSNRWGSIRDRYSGNKSRAQEGDRGTRSTTPYEELDNWDDRPLREWMLQHTRDQGVIDLWEFISVLECMTDDWYDHSASENLYVRKMHYAEARMAGYSFWPEQGWDGMFQDLHDAVLEHGRRGAARHAGGDRPRSRTARSRAWCLGRDKMLPNEFLEGEVLEADCVISTLPGLERAAGGARVGAARLVHGADPVPGAGPPAHLLDRAVPGDASEPVHVIDPTELGTWLHAPKSRRLAGSAST